MNNILFKNWCSFKDCFVGGVKGIFSGLFRVGWSIVIGFISLVVGCWKTLLWFVEHNAAVFLLLFAVIIGILLIIIL